MDPLNPFSRKLFNEDFENYQSRNNGGSPAEAPRYDLIDLFAGAGGMSLGFSKWFGHPFRHVWANDNNDFCVKTYNENFGKVCRGGDLNDLLRKSGSEIPQADVVIGGPPCQGFSLLNKKREGDPRKQLWRPYLDVVERAEASVFVMENVPHLLGTLEHEEIVKTAEKLGFKVVDGKLKAADYGVSQTRIRAFIIGCNFADPSLIFPPRKTNFNPEGNGYAIEPDPEGNDEFLPGCSEWRTVRDAIENLPPPYGTEIREDSPPYDLHFGRNPTELSRRRYRAIPLEGMNRFDLQRLAPDLTPGCWVRKTKGGTDLFGRLWWDKPAFTIRTEFFKPEKGRYLHPAQHRPITHREAARFQGFPDDFIFKGSKIEIAKQIGNAVPPPLAARVADIVRALLSLNR